GSVFGCAVEGVAGKCPALCVFYHWILGKWFICFFLDFTNKNGEELFMIVAEQTKNKFVTKEAGYEVKVHPQSNRLYHIELNKEAIEQFLSTVMKENISVQSLEYTPYQRLIVSALLLDCVGEQIGQVLRGIIHDSQSGGFTLGLDRVTENTDEYVIFATAITHLIGLPNHDA